MAFLQHIEDNVPILREAWMTLVTVDMELNEEYQGFLRSSARR